MSKSISNESSVDSQDSSYKRKKANKKVLEKLDNKPLNESLTVSDINKRYNIENYTLDEQFMENQLDFVKVPYKKEFFFLYNINEFSNIVKKAYLEKKKITDIMKNLNEYLAIAKASLDFVKRNNKDTVMLLNESGNLDTKKYDEKAVERELHKILASIFF